METGRSRSRFVFLLLHTHSLSSLLLTNAQRKALDLISVSPLALLLLSKLSTLQDRIGIFIRKCIQMKLRVAATWFHSAFLQSFQIKQMPIFHRVNHDVGLNLFTHVWVHDFTTREVDLNISTPLSSMHSSVVGDERKGEIKCHQKTIIFSTNVVDREEDPMTGHHARVHEFVGAKMMRNQKDSNPLHSITNSWLAFGSVAAIHQHRSLDFKPEKRWGELLSS